MSSASLKQCFTCGVNKSPQDYYSKGNRADSTCKICVLRKKKKSYKKKKAKSNLVQAVRKISKVLTFENDQVEEKQSEAISIDPKHLENLLRQFVFDSICRSGDKDGEK